MAQNILRLSWLLWVVTILFAWWFIPPRIDDGIYLFPAISVLNGLPPAGIINNTVQPIFFIFPTQPFLHGIFLKFLSFLSIDVGINTYRIFNYSAVILLFWLVHKLFVAIFNSSNKSNYATSAFLILIGLSQFSVQFFINRPEVLALVFFTAGLISAIKFITKLRKNAFYMVTAFFSFGISITLHPNFIIPSGFVVLYLLWLIVVDRKLRYLKLLVAFFIPLLLFLAWFLFNFEVSYDQLFGRVGQATNEGVFDLTAVIEMFSVIIGNSNNTFAHKLYLSIHMLTLLIAILFLLFCLFLKNKSYREDNRITNLFKILSLAILALLFLMESWPPNYLLISFLSIVSVVFYLTNLSFNKPSFIVSNYYTYIGKKLHSTPFLCLVSSLFILSLPVFHSLKVYAYDGYYYNHHVATNKLNNALSGDEQIFINSPQLLPLFSNKINENFARIGDIKKHNIHWYFPIHKSPSVKSQDLMLQTITNDLTLMQGAVWGTLKEYFFFNKDSNVACLILSGRKHYIKVEGVKVLYEDRQNLFFLSKSAKSTNKTSCFDLIIY